MAAKNNLIQFPEHPTTEQRRRQHHPQTADLDTRLRSSGEVRPPRKCERERFNQLESYVLRRFPITSAEAQIILRTLGRILDGEQVATS